ncbi:unnamed protein product [Prorocentrum cordatum]|uniref:EF-hand domain-containing protein n=1 Tax=Prorocentrum cordatum TaxID=2364126 RepID=A0ABN9WW54_9DINO|nr:unnamed protein product [Polarella glacialis]
MGGRVSTGVCCSKHCHHCLCTSDSSSCSSSCLLSSVRPTLGRRIFVEIANHWALNDKASREQAATEKRHSSLKRLYHLFNDMDPGGHGTLTLEGMHEALLDENSHLVSSFHALELEVTDVRTLFLLLDRDRKGFINLEEFLLGCFRLKGEARTLDIMKLQYQCEFIMHNLVNISDVLTRRDACDTWGAAPSPRGSGADTPAGAHTDFRNFSAAVVRQQLGEVLRKSGSAAQSSAAASLTNTSRDGSESPAPRALRNQMSQLSLGSLV